MSEGNGAPIAQQLSNNMNELGTTISQGTQKVAETFSNVRDNVTSTVSGFSQNVSGTASKDFLNSNGIIAKFVFLILVLIAFLVIVKLGIALIAYLVQPSSSPYLVKGINPGNTSLQITQDPSKSGSIQIQRSNNQQGGMEFTWSVWVSINTDSTTKDTSTKYKHVFTKGGNNTFDINTGIMKVNNGPGLYLKHETDGSYTAHVVMNTASNTPTTDISTITETVDIPNIPLNQWVSIIIRLQNKVMDIYINGVITQRLVFVNVPLQNYDDVWVCQNAGFSGQISDLRYFNRALNVFEINSVVSSSPNTTMNTGPNYVQNFLSSSWYTTATNV